MENKEVRSHQGNHRFQHLMGLKLEEAMDFFIRTLKKMGFDVKVTQNTIKAHREDVAISIYFRQLQNPSKYIRHIPRTEVIIYAPKNIHDAIRTHIMCSKAGG